MIKSVFGGGGVCAARSSRELKSLFSEAERESKRVRTVEIFVETAERPKHIEVQVIGDRDGNAVHCFERLLHQRRHQKLLNSPRACARTPDGRILRQQMCDAACELVRSTGYTNAGTVEFLTRREQILFHGNEHAHRVEHTVTEMITGIDLEKRRYVCRRVPTQRPEIGLGNQVDVQYRGASFSAASPRKTRRTIFTRLRTAHYYRSSAGHGVRLTGARMRSGDAILIRSL